VPSGPALSPNPTGEHYFELDRGCFACALGGENTQTLFLVANERGGPESMADGGAMGQVLTTMAPAPGAGWP
jgi:hypothetical protein